MNETGSSNNNKPATVNQRDYDLLKDKYTQLIEKNEQLHATIEQLKQAFDKTEQFKTATEITKWTATATIEKEMFAKVFVSCRNAEECVLLEIRDGKVINTIAQ